jgi:gliding motility-associated-like protein
VNLKLLFIVLITVSSIAQNKNKTNGFKENKGQIIDQKGKPNNAAKYLLNSGGLNVQLRKNGFSYDVYEAKKHPINHSRDEKSKPLPFPSKDNNKLPDYTVEYQFHRIDIDFVNSNPKVELVTEEKSLDYDNYYNIPNKPEGVLMVHQYNQIIYKNIYPNIDVVFLAPKDTLKTVEYNFVVHPKGKISDIQLKFSGAQTELVDNKIRMSVRFGEMEETLPASWTEDGESIKEITVGYTKIKKNVYGFESTENVSNKTVIIDPVPVRLWGTYYGGENMDSPGCVFVKGNFVYWSGQTYSNNNIASTGAHQNYYSSGWDYDAFFAKLNSDGTRVWGTYYGGTYADGISQIKVSNNDNIYIAGTSRSESNISTTGSYQPIKSDYFDGFLAKFDTNGVRQWGTYYGGLDNDKFSSIIIDSDEKIYVSGETGSKENISSNGAFQPNFLTTSTTISNGLIYNGMIVKFDSDGNRIWGTYYYPGTIFDSKINSNGELFFLGTSLDFSLPQSEWKRKGLLIKLNPNGNKIWDTFFGGNSEDAFINLGVDANNNLYCSGQTYSDTGIATTGVFQENYIQNSMSKNSGCILKFNPNGVKIWGSYFFPETLGASVSKNGSIYFTGRVENGFVATPNAYQENPLSNYAGTDSYLVKFNTNGQREWATYYSGESADNAYITAVDDDSYIYLSGMTNSTTNIATPNTYQPNLYPSTASYLPNTADAFLVKFKDCFSLITASSNSPICSGKSLELKASGGTNYAWTGPNGFTSTDQNPTIPNATAINSGQYSCSITGTGDCDGALTVDVNVGDTVAPIPNTITLPTITGDCHTLVTTIPTATDTCVGVITATTASPLSYSLPGTYTLIWDYTDGNNNFSHQNQTVTISGQPFPTATSPQSFCIQQNTTINDIAITGQNIKWYDALTAGTLLLNTTRLQNGITYYASQTINGCESERVPVVVNIQNTAIPTGNAKQTFCTGQNPTLNTIVVVGTAIKWYDSITLGNLLADNTPLVDGKTYYATQTVNNCESTNRLVVTISLISSLPANDYDFSICDDLNDGKETVKLEDYNSYLISNTSNYNFSYYKSLSDAENEVTVNKITTSSNYKLALGENKIYVRINSNDPCYAIIELKLSLLSKPFISIQDILPICENKSISVDAGSGADSYLWSNGKTTQIITVENPQDLSVTVTKNHGTFSCSSIKSFAVKTSNIAKINAIETKDWTDNDNTIIVFTAGLGDYEYSIDGTNYQASNQFTGVNSGEITVHARDKNGCGTATEEIYLLMYPKFFTPNGDGYNDTWKIKSSDIENGLTIKIFDRFGTLLKTLDPNSNGWDGTYTGQLLPATDYWFVVTRENGKEHKGHFSLKR